MKTARFALALLLGAASQAQAQQVVLKVHHFLPSTSNAQVNMEFENGVVGHLTGSYDAAPRHNLERCEVMGTEGRFVLDNCFEELTFYPRRTDELTVIKNSIMGGMTGFNQTFDRRIDRWIQQVSAGVPREEIEASGEDGLAVQKIIQASIDSFENNCVIDIEE